MEKRIAVLPGDGIGPEVMSQAVRVLQKVAECYKHQFNLCYADVGGIAFEKIGEHFPAETKNICEKADAVLFGSVGGPLNEAHLPKWKDCEKNSILSLRKNFQFNANFRPAFVYPQLVELCPLKKEIIGDGIDILTVRELVGDIYFGEHSTTNSGNLRSAKDVAEYNEEQIAAVAHAGFQAAQKRRKKLTSIDKANVLDTSKLWRTVVTEVSANYSDVTLEHMLVDNAAMQLIINPTQFDVLLAPNLFGDILSDASAALPGSLGLMPSASLNAKGFGLYEPAGGSAPDIAGKNVANPLAQILCVAMMLRYSFAMNEEASAIESAVRTALEAGYVTHDIFVNGKKLVGTEEMTDAILENLTA